MATRAKKDQADGKPVVIKSPDDWPVATELRDDVSIEGVNGTVKFNCRAMSHAEFNRICDKYPDHPAPTGDDVTDTQKREYAQRQGQVSLSRMVETIGLCWKPFPGDTIAAQIQWAETNLYRNNEIFALFRALRVLGGRGLMDQNRGRKSAVVADDPEKWAQLTQQTQDFLVPHPDKTLLFRVHGIPPTKMKAIDKETEAPDAPMKPLRGPRGTVQSAAADPNDPEYQAKLRALDIYRDLLIIEEALGFPVPGKDRAEKVAWLGDRPFDEVDQLRAFVVYAVANIEERTDFILGG